jgi:hypothetical protein
MYVLYHTHCNLLDNKTMKIINYKVLPTCNFVLSCVISYIPINTLPSRYMANAVALWLAVYILHDKDEQQVRKGVTQKEG